MEEVERSFQNERDEVFNNQPCTNHFKVVEKMKRVGDMYA